MSAMGVIVEMAGGAARFELPAIMKIESCEELHTFLAAAQSQDVEIDCSRVERLSGLAAQMLLMADASWRRNARTVALKDPSSAFCEGLARLGLCDRLLPQRTLA